MKPKSALKIDTRVRSLKYYLDEFEKGAFQVPSFQREFLWEIESIKQLFDSIKNRYPIGSIQFWQPIQDGDSWLDDDVKIGPYRIILVLNEPKPIFILDGLQRLSTLFGCLTNPKKYNTERLKLDEELYDSKFRIYYDLDQESFEFIKKNSKPKLYQIPLYALVNTSDFRKFQRENIDRIDDEGKIEMYLERADELSKIINDYEIASVDINNATVEEAVEIFWRVNKEGIEISKDWIVNALTNDSNFKLKDAMDDLIEKLSIYNFDQIKRDLLFNCIQSSFGKLSFDVDVVSLIRKDRIGFIETTKKTIKSIEKAVDFLFNRLYLINHKLLPSNWQLVFIVEFFNTIESPTEKQLKELESWFWKTIYSNYFTLVASNPSKRGKSFTQFKNYFQGLNPNILFIDNSDDKIFSPKYKFTNFGSVRFCANVLFQLSQTKENITPETCLGFASIKLLEGEKEDLSNLIYKPIMINDDLLNYHSKKQTSLQFLLSNEFRGMYSELFITDEMRDLYTQKRNEELLKLREKLIEEKENEFIKKILNLELE
ncbi:MAG: DUF262 domain-containing protein [Flavobacterium sp.]|jgi:uncharacterized protein with ParB-like and HNH nuclease domain|uniref:DUF262 domain-containing protein n=1 Tax=Flavobacterium sp. TaxID=239 RepID=UPI0022CB3DC3|nr:DUF262 domain-containing protein [Flavobacterium sp.]MCZ8089755.1 DUF262 domain-containing protein [Flavobacterium sp.]MCZ8329710.1 DUF262 domain-containing protein [Flavobacterium sp.]